MAQYNKELEDAAAHPLPAEEDECVVFDGYLDGSGRVLTGFFYSATSKRLAHDNLSLSQLFPEKTALSRAGNVSAGISHVLMLQYTRRIQPLALLFNHGPQFACDLFEVLSVL